METIASVLDSWSALPLKWRGPDAPKLNALLLKVPGGELRIVGEFLPHVPAHVEHRVFCEHCEGAGEFPIQGHRGKQFVWCERCDGEGYEPLSDAEHNCDACERAIHCCQPGYDINTKFLGVNP